MRITCVQMGRNHLFFVNCTHRKQCELWQKRRGNKKGKEVLLVDDSRSCKPLLCTVIIHRGRPHPADIDRSTLLAIRTDNRSPAIHVRISRVDLTCWISGLSMVILVTFFSSLPAGKIDVVDGYRRTVSLDRVYRSRFFPRRIPDYYIYIHCLLI